MKFEIYGTELKELVDRISGIVPKRTALASLESVKITAKNNMLTLHATDTNNHGIIKMKTDVIEDGVKWVLLKDLKKILGITDIMTVSTNENTIEVRSKKKSYEIPCYDFSDGWFDFPSVNTNNVMCRQHDDEFITHLGKLNNLRSENGNNPMLCAFCLDLPERKIVVLDGHRIGIAHLDGMFSPSCKRIIANGMLYNGLKSLIGKTKDRNFIEIFADDKHIQFEGRNWIYITKQVEGQYFKYDGMVSNCHNNYDYIYKFDSKEIGKIAKEYKKVISSDMKKPMLFCNNCGKVATGIDISSYRTSDIIDSIITEYGMDREWHVGFDPNYIVDTCNVFDGEVTAKGNCNPRNPVIFYNETYDVLILPINTIESDYAFVKKQVA